MHPSPALVRGSLGAPKVGRRGLSGQMPWSVLAASFRLVKIEESSLRSEHVAASAALEGRRVLPRSIYIPSPGPSLPTYSQSPARASSSLPLPCPLSNGSLAHQNTTPPLTPCLCQKEARRRLLETRPRCSQLPRVRRVYTMEASELLQAMRFCASRQLLMRSVWEAFMYRCCVLRGTLSVHQQVQIMRIFASIQRREWCFLNYILEGIRLHLQYLRLADAVLLMAALQRLRLRDELLLGALTPLCIKRIATTTSPPLLALLAHTAVRAGAPHLQQLLQKIYVSTASRLKQPQETQTLSLLLSAYSSYACTAVGVPALTEGPPEGPPEGCPGVREEEEGVLPFKPFIELLLDAAGSSKMMRQMRATDCMHLCTASVLLTRAATAAAAAAAAAAGGGGTGEELVPPSFLQSLLRRVLEVMYEFTAWELAQLLAALLQLPGALTQPHKQQQEQGPLGQDRHRLHQAVSRTLQEMAARAEDFNAETAAQALRHLQLLQQPSPLTEAALLVRLERALPRPLASGVSRHLPILEQVAKRAALPSSLSLQLFLPALVPATHAAAACSSSGADVETPLGQEEWTQPTIASAAAALAETQQQQQQQQEALLKGEEEEEKDCPVATVAGAACIRTAYRLPCASAAALPFVAAIRAKGLATKTASDVSCLLALLQVRDARWAFTLMRLSPQLARSGNPSSSLSQARLAVGLAMLGMPVVADKVSLFPLLSTRTEWPTMEGPLALLQAAALFDLTTKPRSLTPEMIIPAAKALYHRREELSGVSSPVLGFLAASPLLASLPSPLGPFFLSFASESPPPLPSESMRMSALDVLDGLKEGRAKAPKQILSAEKLHIRQGEREEGDDAWGVVAIQKRVEECLQEWDGVSVHRNVCIGSWAYADLAVDLQSLARHMQLQEEREKEGGQRTEATQQVPSSEAMRARALEGDGREEMRLQEPKEETEAATESLGKEETTRLRRRIRRSQCSSSPMRETTITTTPPPPPSPSCYMFSLTGDPSLYTAITPSSHVLVFILLECFDFFSAPLSLQKLGTHRERQTLLSRATKARLSALRRWGWPVVCIREKDWREAEEKDRSGILQGEPSGAPSQSHRRQLFLRLVADLARGERREEAGAEICGPTEGNGDDKALGQSSL